MVFQNNYFIENKKDAQLMKNLVAYTEGRRNLSEKEMKRWTQLGIIVNNKVVFPAMFIFHGTILPSYWVKCLLAYKGMLELNTSETNDTPMVTTK